MLRLVIATVSLALIAPGSAIFAQEEIVIGEYASLTGGSASFGQSSHKGTALAVDEINAAGGVLGKKLKLITDDDQSQAGQPATIARKLISQDKVVAVLGEVASSKSLEAAPICQQSKIPMISPASTNPKVTEVGDYIFRVCFIDPFQGTVMSKFAQSKGWKNVAVLTDVKQDYSVGLAEFFVKDFKASGGQIVKEQKYSTGDKDFKPQLTSIKAAKPDAIFVPGYYARGFPYRQAGPASRHQGAAAGRRRLGGRFAPEGRRRFARRLVLFLPLLRRRQVAESSGVREELQGEIRRGA